MMRKFSLSADGFYVPSIGSTNPITFVKQVKRVIQEKAVCRRARPYRFSVGIHRACLSFSRRPGADLPFAQYVVAGRASRLAGIQLFVFRRLITANATALCACGKRR